MPLLKTFSLFQTDSAAGHGRTLFSHAAELTQHTCSSQPKNSNGPLTAEPAAVEMRMPRLWMWSHQSQGAGSLLISVCFRAVACVHPNLTLRWPQKQWDIKRALRKQSTGITITPLLRLHQYGSPPICTVPFGVHWSSAINPSRTG